jgi:hypothetical protein
MKSSDTLGAISPALVAAINAIDGVKKGAANPAFKGTKYATLEAVIEAAHEHLSANGLAVLQGPGPMQGTALTVTTRIIHVSGEWVETDFTIPLAKQDPQAAGSAVTYARRYSLMAMLNMPAVDDDGEAAMQRTPPPPPVDPVTTLASRADVVVSALNAAATADDLEKAWGKSAKVCADLDLKDPEKLAVITALYEARRDELTTNPFSKAA